MSKTVRLAGRELQKLDDFLCSDYVQETAMDVSTLEGFLTAIVIGPQVVVPSEWLPWVWGFEDGEAEVEFASAEQAEWVMNGIMGLMNNIVDTFAEELKSFEPVYWRSSEWGASEWCEGFLLGSRIFYRETWGELWLERADLLRPFLALSEITGVKLIVDKNSAQKQMEAVQPTLVEIHAFWSSRKKPALEQMADFGASLAGHTIRRDGQKIGRNDPCPCGSGKKYKKCCGTSPTIH